MAGLRDYRGKVAVVTGASSGIGAGLARELARRGARVALVARRRERLEGLAAGIRSDGGRASSHPCDVGDRGSVEAACRAVEQAHGGIDLLVNNAGYVRHVLFKDHDVEDVERMMRVNYLGTVYWIKSALPGMRTRGSGWIVNVSSFAGLVPQPDEAAYSATKYAVTGLSEALAYELAPLGIHVLVAHPTLVRTDMFTPEVMARMPGRAAASFIEVSQFVAQLLRGLERGETSIVIPRRFRIAHLLRELSPKRIGALFAKAKLDPLPDLTR